MIFHTPTARRVRLRSTVVFFFLRLFDRMGLNWLEQSRDPSSENDKDTHTHTRRQKVKKDERTIFFFSPHRR